jgi:hypothetical protein
VFYEKKSKSAILTKNGPKSIFLPNKDTFIRSLVFFLLNLTIFNENKPFWIILEYFSSAHMCFSVAGHSGQNHKKADLSLKINFFQNFQSRFGLLVQIYPDLNNWK